MKFLLLILAFLNINIGIFPLKDKNGLQIAAFDNGIENKKEIEKKILEKLEVFQNSSLVNNNEVFIEIQEEQQILNLFYTQAKYDYNLSEEESKIYATKKLEFFFLAKNEEKISSIFYADGKYDYNMDFFLIDFYIKEKLEIYKKGITIYKNDFLKAIFYADICMKKIQEEKRKKPSIDNDNNILKQSLDFFKENPFFIIRTSYTIYSKKDVLNIFQKAWKNKKKNTLNKKIKELEEEASKNKEKKEKKETKETKILIELLTIKIKFLKLKKIDVLNKAEEKFIQQEIDTLSKELKQAQEQLSKLLEKVLKNLQKKYETAITTEEKEQIKIEILSFRDIVFYLSVIGIMTVISSHITFIFLLLNHPGFLLTQTPILAKIFPFVMTYFVRR